MGLYLVPITLKEANAFVRRLHRHNKPARGCIFCLAVARGEEIVGVGIVGRPCRLLQDGWTCEITRTCTDGTRNANSMLYGAAWRAAKAIGYKRIVTYNLPEETGSSLRAAGFKLVETRAGGGTWSRKNRPRVDLHPLQEKFRWEVCA